MYLGSDSANLEAASLHLVRDIESIRWPKPAQTRSSLRTVQRRNMRRQSQLRPTISKFEISLDSSVHAVIDGTTRTVQVIARLCKVMLRS